MINEKNNIQQVNIDLIKFMQSWTVYIFRLQLLCFYSIRKQHIVVELIKIPVSHRRQGICGQILEELTNIAEGYGLEIWLEPSDNFGVTKNVLSDIYESYGFKWVDECWMHKKLKMS